ncbi:MAG: hypothetical protein A2148_02430 [Chloroflexi bacterium RBG_16_68_14]|nr:MAG: hypothetical protein A2148_02430 [Chloroflexi bacterium RBG_16_68_14]
MAVLNRTLSRTQPKATAALRLGPVLLAAGLVILAIALLQLVQTSEATTTSFAIQQRQQEKLELEASVHQLEAEVAALSSLSRIEQEARRLGLEPPQAQESVVVNVAWPEADRQRLPTRYAPLEEEPIDVKREGSSWWQDLLKLLPFY